MNRAAGAYAGGLSLAALLAGVAPAAATGTIECADPDGRASVELSIGSLPVLAVIHARIETPEGRWSSGDGEALVVGQQFRGSSGLRVDFTDPNVETVIAELRLVSAEEGRDFAMAGTLRVAGEGAWPLNCVGP